MKKVLDQLDQKGPLTRNACAVILYFIAMQALNPAALRPLLPAGRWGGVCLAAFALGLWLARDIFLDWCVLSGHTRCWKAFHGPVEDKELELYQKRILCENQKVAWDRGFAGGYLLVLLALMAAVFLWFSFFAA